MLFLLRKESLVNPKDLNFCRSFLLDRLDLECEREDDTVSEFIDDDAFDFKLLAGFSASWFKKVGVTVGKILKIGAKVDDKNELSVVSNIGRVTLF